MAKTKKKKSSPEKQRAQADRIRKTSASNSGGASVGGGT